MNTLTVEREALTPEMTALKAKLQATWTAGDYGHFATYLEPGALVILDRLALEPGTRVLDVACGAGQLAIPAARAGAQVTGIDIAANSIAQAQARAKAEDLDVRFDVGDAENLPYADASFDVVVSLIGAMFAPQPERVAAELVRVCRPGGRIVMANWTAEGFVGQMFKVIGQHVPPSPLMPSPLKWGDEATVRERLRAGVMALSLRQGAQAFSYPFPPAEFADLQITKRLYPFHYPFSPAQVVEFYRNYYGPANRAFAALDAAGQAALRRDLEQLWSTHNRSNNGSTHCEPEYLEVIATRA